MNKKFENMEQITSVQQGFTLVELAIVLSIVGLLLAMIIPSLSAQRDIRNRNETLHLLNQAKEALIGYVLVNRHLPCPDAAATPNGVEGARTALGACLNNEGVLPWNTLGIGRTDAWNHYFGYRAEATFSNNMTLFTIADAENPGGMQIQGEGGINLVSTNSRPVAIILSYGANGFGSINTVQATPANIQPAPATTALDETENTDGDTIFVTHPPTQQGSVNEFDDLLVWVSPKILVSYMVSAGRLP